MFGFGIGRLFRIGHKKHEIQQAKIGKVFFIKVKTFALQKTRLRT